MTFITVNIQRTPIFTFPADLDMIKRLSLRTRNIKMLILDEADEMLTKGERNEVMCVCVIDVKLLVGTPTLCRVQGADLRHLPLLATFHSGKCSSMCKCEVSFTATLEYPLHCAGLSWFLLTHCILSTCSIWVPFIVNQA